MNIVKEEDRVSSIEIDCWTDEQAKEILKALGNIPKKHKLTVKIKIRKIK